MTKRKNNKTLKKDEKVVDIFNSEEEKVGEREEELEDELEKKEDEENKKNRENTISSFEVKKKDKKMENDMKDIIKPEADLLDAPKEETEEKKWPILAIGSYVAGIVFAIIAFLGAYYFCNKLDTRMTSVETQQKADAKRIENIPESFINTLKEGVTMKDNIDEKKLSDSIKAGLDKGVSKDGATDDSKNKKS